MGVSPFIIKLGVGAVTFSHSSFSHSLSFPFFVPFSLFLFLFLFSSLFDSSSASGFLPHTHPLIPDIMTRTSELISSKNRNSSQTRSWRRTVAHAVSLAQWAVELDSKNSDPMAALEAYTESVRHLRGILARLERHGAHAEVSRLATIVCRHPLLHPLCPVLNELASNGSVTLIASGCVCCA